MPLSAQARLARVWSRHCPYRLKSLLEALQQLITLRVIMSRDYCVQDDEAISAPTKLMKVNPSVLFFSFLLLISKLFVSVLIVLLGEKKVIKSVMTRS